MSHRLIVAPADADWSWHLLINNCDYDDLGGDWFMRRTETDKRRDFLIRQLHDLGYRVALTKAA